MSVWRELWWGAGAETSPWRSFGHFTCLLFGFGRRLAGLLGLVLLGLFLSAVFRGFVQSVRCEGILGRFAYPPPPPGSGGFLLSVGFWGRLEGHLLFALLWFLSEEHKRRDTRDQFQPPLRGRHGMSLKEAMTQTFWSTERHEEHGHITCMFNRAIFSLLSPL